MTVRDTAIGTPIGRSWPSRPPLQERRKQRSVCLIRKRRAVMAGMKQVNNSRMQRQVNWCLNIDCKHHGETWKLPPDPLQRCAVEACQKTDAHSTKILLEN